MAVTNTGNGDGDLADHPGVARVREALARFGAQGEVVVLRGTARTAAEAAEQLGVDIGQIANSLVFAATESGSQPRAVLVLTSGSHRVDVGQVAAVLGVETLKRADPDLVRASTGFAIGGVPPVGHLHPVETVVDVALAGYQQIWAAAGHPRAVFATSYDELLRMTGGRPAEVD